MKDRVVKYLLILPAGVVVVGTTIWPLASALIASFRDWRLKRSPLPGRFVGLDMPRHEAQVTGEIGATCAADQQVLSGVFADEMDRNVSLHGFTLRRIR